MVTGLVILWMFYLIAAMAQASETSSPRHWRSDDDDAYYDYDGE
jgi:hypothetical protein